jgi:hypothetical protein
MIDTVHYLRRTLSLISIQSICIRKLTQTLADRILQAGKDVDDAEGPQDVRHLEERHW